MKKIKAGLLAMIILFGASCSANSNQNTSAKTNNTDSKEEVDENGVKHYDINYSRAQWIAEEETKFYLEYTENGGQETTVKIASVKCTAVDDHNWACEVKGHFYPTDEYGKTQSSKDFEGKITFDDTYDQGGHMQTKMTVK